MNFFSKLVESGSLLLSDAKPYLSCSTQERVELIEELEQIRLIKITEVPSPGRGFNVRGTYIIIYSVINF